MGPRLESVLDTRSSGQRSLISLLGSAGATGSIWGVAAPMLQLSH